MKAETSARLTRWLRRLPLIAAGLALLAVGYGLRWAVTPAPGTGAVADPHAGHDMGAKARPTIWTCSMHPEVKRDQPGKCPKCGMELIPLVTQDDGGGSLRTYQASAVAKALLDVRTAPVERRLVTAEVRMIGKISYDETRLTYITAWVPGRLDRLFVDYTGIAVNKGDHMVQLYSPQLLSAQEELGLAHRAARELPADTDPEVRRRTEATLTSARERLRLWGLSPEQIREIERRGKPVDHITIGAPISGIVVHKNAQQGMYVQTGSRIYTLADLSRVWVVLDAYESDLAWLRYGQTVMFTSVAYPGETFTGTIAFISPTLDERTRTVRVRVNAPNGHGKLKPGMFVGAIVRSQVAGGGMVMDPALAGKWICKMHPSVVKGEAGTCDVCQMPLVTTESLGYVTATAEMPLVIPAQAALVTGTRAIVYVAVPGAKKPTFEGREVLLGPRAGNDYIVRRGLTEGERVVVRGNFNIDSALQILAKPSMMTPDGGGAAGHDHGGGETKKPAPGGGHEGHGKTPKKKHTLAEPVRLQLHAVLAAADGVARALAAGRLSAVRDAFAALAVAVDAVDGAAIGPMLRPQWGELEMRLGNDAAEGRGAALLLDARAVGASLSHNIAQLRKRLPLGTPPAHAHVPKPRPKPTAKVTRTAAFEGQYTALLAAHDAVATALAADALHPMHGAVAKLSAALKAVDATGAGDGRAAWTAAGTELTRLLAQLGSAADLKAARVTFALLSERLERLFAAVPPPRPVHVLRCSMAFGGRGGRWLQPDQETRNPYFGKAMRGCGDVVRTVAAAGGAGGR